MILTEYNAELGKKTLKEEGSERGAGRGVDLFADLMKILSSSGRLEDAERASSDKAFREALFKKYNLL